MFPGTDVPRSYVPRYRCSPVPMFPGTFVPRYLCSPNLCSPVPMFPGTDVPRTYVPRYRCSPIYCKFHRCQHYGTLPLSGVNSRFLAPSRFPDFHLKCPAFLCEKRWEKCTLCALLRRLGGVGNQLPMLGKGNSFGKFIKFGVFACLLNYDFVLAA